MTRRSNLRVWVVISIVLIVFVSPTAAKVIYVDANAPGANNGQDWPNAYNYLQDALAAANAGDEIWVAEGIYRPDEDATHPYGTGDRTATFQLKNGVAVYGGFKGYIEPPPPPPPPPMSLSNVRRTIDLEAIIQPGIYTATNVSLNELDLDPRDIELYETILSGDLNGDDGPDFANNEDNSYHVLTGSGTDANAVLDGLTITGGNADGSYPYNWGGGMYNYLGSPTLISCTFKYNLAVGGGGMANGEGSSPTLRDCSFSANRGNSIGGGMANYLNSSSRLTRCTFNGNWAHGAGGGIYNASDCSVTMTECIFSENSTDINGGGVYNLDCNPKLTNCTFTANWAMEGGAMLNTGESNVTISNCTFTGNSALHFGGGMWNYLDSNIILTNCLFSRNSAGSRGGGINSGANSSTILNNCTFNINSSVNSGGGIYNNSSIEPNLTNCILWGNINGEIEGSAIISYSNVQGGWLGLGNIDTDPCFVDPNNGDYHLRADSMCIHAGDPNYVAKPNETDMDGKPRIIGGRIDMGVYEYQDLTIYIDQDAPGPIHDGSSWAYAYKHLQDALADANSSNKPIEIRVAQGIYKPDQASSAPPPPPPPSSLRDNWNDLKTTNVVVGDRANTFKLINGVTIRGGYAGASEPYPNARNVELYETVLSGDLDGNDVHADPCDLPDEPTRAENSYHVVTGSGTGPNAVLDGFTITGGNANSSFPDNCGGGLHNYTGSPTVTNCTFEYNTAIGGGGTYNYLNSNPTLTNCTFRENFGDGGGGVCNTANSNPSVINCRFKINSAIEEGGGMLNYDSSPQLSNCTFILNSAYSGAGICNIRSNPTISNCTFIENSSYLGGGIMNEYSCPMLINCVFTKNSAIGIYATGGGINNNECTKITIVKCLFTENFAESKGGGIYSKYRRGITLKNCTFANNSAGYNGGAIYCEYEPSPFPPCLIQRGGLIITNSILWINTPDHIYGGVWTITYSDVQGGWPGLGNIDADPCFVDTNNSDYHLKSQAGRWDANSESWVADDVTSPCIDAGNPGCPVGDEPIPNGNRRNMGAYGGTAEASKSPTYWRSISDMTNDWVVDSNDLKVFADYWLQKGECLPADFDRSQSVDFNDFAILGRQWRQEGPGPGITYDIGGCIPVDFTSSAVVEFEPTRFTVTVEGRNIQFEDLVTANCCADEIELQMTLEEDLITITEIEHLIGVPCPCICDNPHRHWTDATAEGCDFRPMLLTSTTV